MTETHRSRRVGGCALADTLCRRRLERDAEARASAVRRVRTRVRRGDSATARAFLPRSVFGANVIDWPATSLKALLFVPGSDKRKLARAGSFGSDAIIIDLEDAVAEEAKDGARATTRAAISAFKSDAALMVRVNGVVSASTTTSQLPVRSGGAARSWVRATARSSRASSATPASSSRTSSSGA